MATVGIIAEFNPLHYGHYNLIKSAKKSGPVVCAISGNFVQRGDIAVVEKEFRVKAALNCGADIVVEIPTPWGMSTAQNFALGGVTALNALGCDKIMFGSESGDTEKLINTVKIFDTKEFKKNLEDNLALGISFAKARQCSAVLCGADAEIFNGANDNLALEYIFAAKKQNFNFEFSAFKRTGPLHDSTVPERKNASASLIRTLLKQNKFKEALEFIPKTARTFSQDNIADLRRLETAILSSLRSKNSEDFKKLPDLSEGLENKLFKAVKESNSLEELYENIKVKRYTLSRIRRLVLSSYLGIDNSFFMKPLPYVRVLGFSKSGEEYLKSVIKSSPIPIVLRVSDIEELGAYAKQVFEIENRATDQFALAVKKPLNCGIEYTKKIIKVE